VDSPMDKLYEAYLAGGGDPSEWPHDHWFRCPACGSLGRIDRSQYEGEVSIICTDCAFHGYRKEVTP